jgi:putative nucleotidyltransferase with HDIG domain
VRNRILAIDEIATLPSGLARVFSVVQNESTTALDLAAEIAMDQALTMKVLRTVNSSYYGFPRHIQSIPEAVVMLGFSEVERLALSISVINVFGRDLEGMHALSQLWRHSLACSVIGSVLEQRHRSTRPQVIGAQIAGLLHDVGKAVIAQHFPDEMRRIVRLIQKEQCSVRAAEHEVLEGVTHSEIGAWLAEGWGLSPALVESIARHHCPETAPENHALTHAAHLSDLICNKEGITDSNAVSNGLTPCAKSLRCLPLDDALLDRVHTRLDKQRGLIGAVALGAAV